MYVFQNECAATKLKSLPGHVCPYWRLERTDCAASVMTVTLDERRKALYCGTEAYDCCAIFLAKMLRGE